MRTMTVVLALLCSAAAWAVPPGTLLVTAAPVDTTDPSFLKDVEHRAVHELDQSGGQWTINFVAFLKRAAGAKLVQLVFYDAAVKEHQPVNNFPISTQAKAKILAAAVSFGPDQGFVAGHQYHVLITRLIGGKEQVYARTTLKLK